MIHILTLKVGTKYSSNVVNNLYKELKYHSTTPFKFWCYTENKKGLDPDIKIINLTNPEKYKLQWHKVKFHKTNFANIPMGDDCIIMDIDMKILQDVDAILNFPINKNEFGCVYRWWSDRTHQCPINGGFQKFKMGSSNMIWKLFEEKPDFWQPYYINRDEAFGPVNGEQNFIHNHIEAIGLKRKYLPLEWFGKHNENLLENYIKPLWNQKVSKEPYMKDNNFNKNIKIIHYSNG